VDLSTKDSMTEDDQPALWKTSSAAAEGSQWWFLLWLRVHLLLLAATGLIAGWVPEEANKDHLVSGIIAFLMFVALIIGLVLKLARLDDAWFRARAFAENAKGAAWRFMMTPRPDVSAADEAQERTYLEELQEIRDRFPQIEKHLSKFDTGGDELTPKMRQVRTLGTADRLAFYEKFRLQDQINWYRLNAKSNATAESKWFAAILVVESFAIVAAVARVATVHEYNPTGGIAAVAACLVAWSQTKRFSDLANSYGVASQDLRGLRARAEHVHDEEMLRQFVTEVETAVSREHRLWLERRSA
jgi:hypothetical protein